MEDIHTGFLQPQSVEIPSPVTARNSCALHIQRCLPNCPPFVHLLSLTNSHTRWLRLIVTGSVRVGLMHDVAFLSFVPEP